LRRSVLALAALALLLALPSRPVRAAVNVERSGAENPVLEVAKSTIYGGLAGLVVGGAIALVTETDDGEVVKWGFVSGTFLGLGFGIYHVSRRPEPTGLLHVEDGAARLALRAPRPAPAGGVRVDLVSVRF
jgi:hypothetical protein